ncbi:MAG: HD domain-containing phosphohydrolase [Eubacteriales bacterium]|jgi:putative nucleotidyltransferase with HDIG domain
MDNDFSSPDNTRFFNSQGEATLPIDEVKPGMICMKGIEDRLGRMLVQNGAVLNSYVIERLKQYGVTFLEVRKPGYEDVKPVKKRMSSRAQKAVRTERKPDPPKVQLDHQVKERISRGVELMYSQGTPEVLFNVSSEIADDLLNAIDANDAVALNLMELETSDEYTFNHCVDVATISMITAKNQGLSQTTVRDIGIAGILHDIGKSKVPPEVLNKPARLTTEEFNIIKKHSLYSYEMIRDIPALSDDIKKGVLEHHEKIDGSGYPYGLKGDKIAPYAKVLSVSDIYDALCTTRPYKKGYTPRESVEMLSAMTDKLDIDVLHAFFSSMILYPVDTIVRLSNGEDARVVRANPGLITRPVVVGLKSGRVYDLSSAGYLDIVIDS